MLRRSSLFRFATIAIGVSGLTLATGSASVAEVLLTDTFDTANNTNINQNLATRQTGTLATASYNQWAGTSQIVSNQLQVNSGSGAINQANLEPSITASTMPFAITFHLANTGSSWAATYLSDTTNSERRGESPFGFHLWQEASTAGFTAYGGSFGSQTSTSANKATISAALGYTFEADVSNTYQLSAAPATATTGTYDVLINGVVIVEDIPYNFGTSNFYWASRTNTGGVGVYDNLDIAIVPEPSGLALLGLGALLIVCRRRRGAYRAPNGT